MIKKSRIYGHELSNRMHLLQKYARMLRKKWKNKKPYLKAKKKKTVSLACAIGFAPSLWQIAEMDKIVG